MQGLIGLVGLFVFLGYVYFLLKTITKQHQIQREEHRQSYEHQIKSDFIDYDGHGNFGRFPKETTNLKKRRFRGVKTKQ